MGISCPAARALRWRWVDRLPLRGDRVDPGQRREAGGATAYALVRHEDSLAQTPAWPP